MIFPTLFLFFFGAILGSFLNVLISRYNPEGAVFGNHLGGRSMCPKCKKNLNWYELLPIISFIIQAGRCRKCNKKISWQYPIVELLSGAIVATIPLILGFSALAFVWGIALLVLLTASVIDIREYVIPDALTIIVALLGIISIAIISISEASVLSLIPGTFLGSYAYVFSFTDNLFIARLSAAIILGAFFSSVILLSRGKAMGWGDAKLAVAIGLMLGWPDAIMAIMIAFILGALVGIFTLIFNKKGLKDALPFGPFITFGTALVVYFGHNIISAYFTLINMAL